MVSMEGGRLEARGGESTARMHYDFEGGAGAFGVEEVVVIVMMMIVRRKRSSLTCSAMRGLASSLPSLSHKLTHRMMKFHPHGQRRFGLFI